MLLEINILHSRVFLSWVFTRVVSPNQIGKVLIVKKHQSSLTPLWKESSHRIQWATIVYARKNSPATHHLKQRVSDRSSWKPDGADKRPVQLQQSPMRKIRQKSPFCEGSTINRFLCEVTCRGQSWYSKATQECRALAVFIQATVVIWFKDLNLCQKRIIFHISSSEIQLQRKNCFPSHITPRMRDYSKPYRVPAAVASAFTHKPRCRQL